VKIENKKKVFLILDNIRSVQNTGAIFRTADAAGISKIYLCGYTPAPIDRFGRKRKDFIKTSLGAEKTVNWEKCESIEVLLEKLKNENVFLAAIEQSENSLDYKKFEAKFPIAFIFGNEVSGISENILKKCDVVLEIPMMGKKESLNISVSLGIAIFRILNI
jgi:tRNA G18 (ribose-2'-O)-methylase SpoU